MPCLQPIKKKDGDIVPCSKCLECKKRRISGWSFRLMQEDKVSMSAYFITLTYDTSTVHITRAGYMGLVKRDLQLFIKRLRKAHEGRGLRPIKYYAVGEYGGAKLRPHYHIIIFNVDIELMVSKNDYLALKQFQFDGKHPVKCIQWDKGHMTVGQVTGASVGYTLKYVCKPSRIPMHRNDDRLKEFSLMSKGLGVSYLSEAVFKWHHDSLTDRMYLTLEGGQKIGMPRYYKEKLYDVKEKMEIARTMEKLMIEAFIEGVEYYDDPVKHRKAQREAVQVGFEKMAADYNRGRNQF